MRLKDITAAHQRLLRALSNRISNGLEAEFTELPDADGPNVGVVLREHRRRVVMEIPALGSTLPSDWAGLMAVIVGWLVSDVFAVVKL